MSNNVHDLIGSECQYGHKHSYQQAINQSMPTNDHDIISSECHQGTQAKLTNKL